MAFTKALYYPYIRIQNEAWLKTALLYWDTIQTIVPESIDSPYSGDVSREFADSGLLRPLKVSPRRGEIQDLSGDVLNYLNSSEGAGVLAAGDLAEWAYIHPDKLPSELRYRIERHFGESSEDGWVQVNPQFGHLYMSLLASRLADNHGLGLLTDNGQFQNLADSNRLDAKFRFPAHDPWDRPRSPRRTKPDWVQGYMAHLILDTFELDPDTPPKKIITYRRKFKDEIGRFREEVGKLTEDVCQDVPLEALQQQLKDIYNNRVSPALADLGETLKDAQIECAAGNLLKIGFFSVGSTSIPLALLGMSVPWALVTGVSFHAALSAVLYNRKKKAILRKNPYSCVLAAENFLL